MINPFCQRIGVWYSDRERAEKVFDIMKSWYEYKEFERIGNMVESIRKNKNEMSIWFKNGDWIKFLPAYESMRSQRLTDSFIIGDIDKEFIDVIIRPVTTMSRGNVWIIDDENEMSTYDSIMYRERYK